MVFGGEVGLANPKVVGLSALWRAIPKVVDSHIICGNRIVDPAGKHAFEGGDGQFRDQDDRAIRVKEDFDSISWPNPKMLPGGLGNRHLAFAGKSGFHAAPLFLIDQEGYYVA
jgi:hypothetical protein